MWWSTVLEHCLVRAIARPSRHVNLVLSPDVDGVLSACLLAHYLWGKHNVATHIVGTYNGRCIRSVNNVSARELCNAVWLDLDTRFTEVRTSVGNHFLGPVRVAPGSFNPNALFQIERFQDKYPFGTAHLLLFGPLRGIHIPNADLPSAQAIFAHADSCFYVCERYRKNAARWADRLFDQSPTPKLLQQMMAGEYLATRKEAHQQFIQRIHPYVYRGKPQTYLPPEWAALSGFQTCRAQNGTVQFRNVHALVDEFTQLLGTRRPVTFDPLTCRTVWTGTKIRVEPSVHTEDLEKYMQANSIRSHAMTSFRSIGMTQGPPLLSGADAQEATFY
jgi:hypothetical protein